MGIYVISFVICIILAYIIPRIEDKKYLKYIFLISIILILSIVGGCRDYSIGTDVEVYARTWFEKACDYTNFFDYMNTFTTNDKGYLLLNFLVSRVTSSVNMFLFVLQFISNGLIIVTLYNYRKKVPFWLALLTFLSIYYFRTYNYMRQSIALAILFFAIRYIDNKKLIKYLIFVALATTFHDTAIIGALLYPLCHITRKNNKVCNYSLIALIFFLVIITFNIVNVITLLHDLGIVNDKIYNYTGQFLTDTMKFYVVHTFFRIFFIILYALRFKELNKKDSLNKFLFICLIIDVIFYQFKMFMSYSNRISLYFGYLMILIIPKLPDALSVKYKNRFIMKVAIALVIVLYCYYDFVLLGTCDIYPYKSTILGI